MISMLILQFSPPASSKLDPSSGEVTLHNVSSRSTSASAFAKTVDSGLYNVH